MTGPHWKARTDELRANAAHVEIAELRADNERWRVKFEASQLVAGKAIRERAEALATVDRQAARILALSHDLTDATRERDEWHRLAVESDREASRIRAKLDAACRRLIGHGDHLGKELSGYTHDGIRSDKAIRPRA